MSILKMNFHLILFQLRILFIIIVINVHPASSCLKCDKNSKIVLREFFNFLDDQLWEVRAEYVKIRDFYNAKYNEIMEKHQYKTLDKFGINELAKEYKIKIKQIKNTKAKGMELLNVVSSSLKALQPKVDYIFEDFENRSCPNQQNAINCGILNRNVINCDTCKEEKLVCIANKNKHCHDVVKDCQLCICVGNLCQDKNGKRCKPCVGKLYSTCIDEVLNCGRQEIKVKEDDDINFKCGVKFHRRVQEAMEYILEKKKNHNWVILKTVSDPQLVKYAANMEDAGDYSCTARSLKTKIPISTININVIVIKIPTKPTPHPILNMDPITMNPGTTKKDLTVTIAAVIISICSILIIILVVLLGVYLLRKRKRDTFNNMIKEKEMEQQMLNMAI